jgi:electron transport complex protein RnfC
MRKPLRLLRRFKGGVYPPENKHLTEDKSIIKIEAPHRVIVPLQQHIGAPCKPRVKKGDDVGVGTVLGDVEAFVSAPVHCSVSGKVVQVAPQPNPLGKDILSVIVENDGAYSLDPSVVPPPRWEDMEPEEIRKGIREAGIVGLGGATFPTHVKLNPPRAYPIDTIILNGAECEPYLTSDYRLLLEETNLVLEGLRIIMRTVGAKRGIIAIEDNKPKALKKLKGIELEREISVASLKTRYPQGAEKVLITNLLGREVPSGGLPMHVGVVVNNVGTAHAIARYFNTGLPFTERVVTVTGSVIDQPSNLLIPLGTTFEAAIEACGGFKQEPAKVIMGGPMMGLAQYSLQMPVIKATSGILALSQQEVDYEMPAEPLCIRCGRCVDTCPMNLIPTYLAANAHVGKWEELRRFNILDCIECGCCNYVCPTKNPIVQLVKTGKAELARLKQREEEPASQVKGGEGGE